MSVIFDNHAHCFPPLAEDRGIKKRRLAEHQHHVRFHGQGIRRLSDGVRIPEQLLVGEGDGISYLPDVDFRIGPSAGWSSPTAARTTSSSGCLRYSRTCPAPRS